MGTLLKATCECGFESDYIHLGFGMFGHGSYCPACGKMTMKFSFAGCWD